MDIVANGELNKESEMRRVQTSRKNLLKRLISKFLSQINKVIWRVSLSVFLSVFSLVSSFVVKLHKWKPFEA